MPAPANSALTRINRPASAARDLFAVLAGSEVPAWDRIAPEIVERRIDAGGTVFMQDAEHPFVYVVRSGLIKNVYFGADGEEWIKSFCEEGRFFASIAALEPAGRTSFAAIAVEPSMVERLPFSLLERQAEQDLVWARILRRALLIFGERKEKRERELLTLRAEARYRAFVEDSPGLERRVPQRDLARHLGLTPVGLNRIVQRVRNSLTPSS